MFAKLAKTYIAYHNKHTQYLLLQKYFTIGSEITQVDTSCSKPISNLDQDDLVTEMPSGDKRDGYDLVYKIRECARLGLYDHGRRIHCYVLRSGFKANVLVSSALINFYVKIDRVKNAHKLFDEIPEPSLVAWNSLISGYVHSGMSRKALNLFLELERSSLGSDPYSFTAALAACGRLNLVQLGKSIHSKIVKSGVECSTYVANCLIDMYGKCRHVDNAIKLFNEMCDKDTISWNSVIAASARNQRIEKAFVFLHQMPNPDTISYNEVINGIAQFGNLEQAIDVLSSMPNPNSSSWNSIITGYVNRNRPREALQFLIKMHSNDIQMDQFTFSSILSGIARLGALRWGILVHCCAVKFGLDQSIVVGSALIDMYSKCGQVSTAEVLFKSLPDKNLVTWNAMISGYAHNENFTEVIQLFGQLKSAKDLQPDGITFLNVLSACWHRKMPIEVANQYFESMINDYGIEPTIEHCSCIIRHMGQEGEVGRAKEMMDRVGFGSCGPVWRALLGTCGVSGNLEVAEMAARKIIELEGHDDYVCVMMSNLYARFGKWEDAGAMRKLMSDNKVIKEAGYSWIEIEDKVVPAPSIV